MSNIETRGLSGRWGRFSLRDISLRVEAGEYMALIGPTGSGKTLLIETLAGFHSPEAGSVYIDDIDVTLWPPEKRSIGYVPQHQSLFPNMTVKENIEFGPRLRKMNEKDSSRKSCEVMEALGIGHLSGRAPRGLSGGERQKVSLARALVLEPNVLLLDEPMSSVDAMAHRDLMAVLRETHNVSGATFVHVTHSHEEASVLADTVGVLMGGRLRQSGAYMDVYRRPESSDVAALLGFDNVYSVAGVSESVVEISGKTLVHADGRGFHAAWCGFRRESVEVHGKDLGGENVLEGKVTESLGVGDTGRFIIDAGITIVASRRGETFSVGEHVYVRVPRESIVLWGS